MRGVRAELCVRGVRVELCVRGVRVEVRHRRLLLLSPEQYATHPSPPLYPSLDTQCSTQEKDHARHRQVEVQ